MRKGYCESFSFIQTFFLLITIHFVIVFYKTALVRVKATNISAKLTLVNKRKYYF